jgi:hypothetical protein
MSFVDTDAPLQGLVGHFRDEGQEAYRFFSRKTISGSDRCVTITQPGRSPQERADQHPVRLALSSFQGRDRGIIPSQSNPESKGMVLCYNPGPQASVVKRGLMGRFRSDCQLLVRSCVGSTATLPVKISV